MYRQVATRIPALIGIYIHTVMGCCTSSTGDDAGAAQFHAAAADRSTLNKSTEAAQDSMVVIGTKECTVSSEVNNTTAATTGCSQEIGGQIAADERKRNMMRQKSATISGSSIGVPTVDKTKRAHTMSLTDSMSMERDKRYWVVDLKG